MIIRGAISKEVHEPERGHAHDAGMDFYVPKFDEAFITQFRSLEQNANIAIDNREIILKPGEGAMIPSGVHLEIPIGMMGLYLNKSGVATKKRLLIGAQVIDTYYDGECHINVHNVSDRNVSIKTGDKLAQMVLVPVAHADFLKVEKDELYNTLKEGEHRAAGGFGSTGEKK